MPQERLTKDQRRELAREQARIERERRQRAEKRNRILVRGGVTLGIVAVLAAVGTAIWFATRPIGPGPVNMASDGVLFTGGDGEIEVVETPGIENGEDPTPTDPSDYDAPAHIVSYIDFGCPYCNLFETTNADQIRELVADGAATLEVHPINLLTNAFQGDRYSARSANAGACVAAYEPDAFLDYSAALFAQQPAETGPGLTNDQLAEIAAGVGADSDRVAGCIRGGEFRGWVDAATQRALAGPLPNTQEQRVTGTPTILVNGVRYTGPLDDPSAFASFVAAQSE